MNDVVERELNAIIRAARDLIRGALRPDIDLDTFLADVLEQTQGLVPFDVGWLLLREGDSVRVRATDASHRADLGTVLPIDDCISGLSMLRRAPINIPDLAHMPEALRRAYKPSRSTEMIMRSELVVPLMIGENAIGSISIESQQPAAFAPRQVELLRLLGDHAALAIELARSRQEAAALGAISLQLARETEMSDVVRTVLERALALIAGRFGQLLLSEGPDLVVRYTTNVPPRDVGLRFGTLRCVSGLAVHERKPVIVPDVTRADYWVVEFSPEAASSAAAEAAPARVAPRSSGSPRYQRVLEREKERVQAELVVPLRSGDRLVGALNIETPHEDGFSERQRGDLVAFGERVGARFAAALAEQDAPELHALLDEALEGADTTFGQLLAIEGDELVIVQTTGGEPAGTRVSVPGSVSGQAVATGAALYIPDVEAEPRYRRYLGEEMKSELAVPLISRRSPPAVETSRRDVSTEAGGNATYGGPQADGEQVIGVLNVESPAPGFFTAEHARILQALAGPAAVAIERAQRTEVERLAAIGSLSGDIIHRLNNPIGALGGWLDMLQRKAFYPQLVAAYPYVAQFVARAQRDVGHAKSIIQELRTELRRQVPAAIGLQAAITEALERCGLLGSAGALSEDAAIRVDLALPPEPADRPEPVRVMAGPGLTGVFWNLFDNARKAMPGGGTLSVTVRGGEAPGWLSVEVADTGVGIEPWRLPGIFEAGGSTTADSFAPAHGLGLWWTRSQVESFGGAIEVASEVGAGTRFTIRLRAAP